MPQKRERARRTNWLLTTAWDCPRIALAPSKSANIRRDPIILSPHSPVNSRTLSQASFAPRLAIDYRLS